MRSSSILLVSLLPTLGLQGAARAGISVAGTYAGTLEMNVSLCDAGGDDDLLVPRGEFTVNDLANNAFDGTGVFTTRRLGGTFDLDIAISGTVDAQGVLVGTYTDALVGTGFSSAGSGTLSGLVSEGVLSLDLTGQATDSNKETCAVDSALLQNTPEVRFEDGDAGDTVETAGCGSPRAKSRASTARSPTARMPTCIASPSRIRRAFRCSCTLRTSSTRRCSCSIRTETESPGTTTSGDPALVATSTAAS